MVLYEIPDSPEQVQYDETFDNTLDATHDMPFGQSASQIVPDGDQIQTANYKRLKKLSSIRILEKFSFLNYYQCFLLC